MRITVSLFKYPAVYVIVLLLLVGISCDIGQKSITHDQQRLIDSAFVICRKFQAVPLDTLDKYSRVAEALLENSNQKLPRAEAALWRSQYHINAGNYDSALFFSEQVMALDMDPDEADTLFVGNRARVNKGVALYYKGDVKEAIAWYYKILPELERDGDHNNYYRTYVNIGLGNAALNRYSEAINCYEKVYNTLKKEIAPYLLATTYHNTGDAYANLGMVDSALKYETLALNIARDNNYVLLLNNALNTLGKVYYEKGDYEKALSTVLASIEMRKANVNLFYHVVDLCQLARIYTALHKNDLAIATAEQASKLAEENKLVSLYYTVGESLYIAYYGAKMYKEASEKAYGVLSIMYKANESASAEALAELEAKYEAKKKETQILNQKAEIDRQEIIIAGAIGLFLLGATIIFAIFKNYKHKQRQQLQEIIIQEQDQAARSIIRAEERERSKISQNLHDSVGQLLSGLKLNLQALDERIETREEANIFQNSMKLLEESIHEIRNVSHQILPNNIMRLGLGNAVRSLINKINQDKLRITFALNGQTEGIGSDKQLMIYRILQESINNVIKHARAENMELSITVDEEKLTAFVKDDGIGFDTEKVNTEAGIGLGNIYQDPFFKGRHQHPEQTGKRYVHSI